MNMKLRNSKKGFTLVELIVVIAIIGILAAVLIPSITGYIEKASYSNDQQDAGNMTKLVQAYCAENKIDISELTPNEVKTIILSSGQYNLKSRNSNWTFVWNIAENKVQAMYYNESIIDASFSDNRTNYSTNLDTSSSINYPEEVLKSGYYLIGKGNTKIEEVVNLIRNYDGSEDYSTILNKLDNTAFSKYKGTLYTMFNPSTTLFINEKGAYSSATDTYLSGSESGTPDEYELLTSQNYANDLKFYIKDGESWISLEGNIVLYTFEDDKYQQFNSTNNPYGNVVTLYYKLGESDYVKVYIGKKYPTLQRVIFGDSISYIPTFGDKLRLPEFVKVPATIEFISEGAFINVVSHTKLLFSATPVFETGFVYNPTMLEANGGVQPISNLEVDYEKKGIKLISIKISNSETNKDREIVSGDYVDLNKEQISTINNLMLDLESIREKYEELRLIDSIDFRIGYTDDFKIHEGKVYFCKFVIKLYSNNRLVGYFSIYYRESDVKL